MTKSSAMKLLVLAGGFGTRLQSVIADVPKALAPVGNVPFLHLQIANFFNSVRDSNAKIAFGLSGR